MKKILIATGCTILLFAMPVFAGLIYEWEDYDGLATSAVGSIEFNDGVTIGQFADTSNVTSFSFTTPNGEVDVWGFGLFGFDSIELGLNGLCIPDCATHGVAKKKAAITKKKAVSGGTTDVYFFPTAVKLKADANAKLWDWESILLGTDVVDEIGFGRWVLASDVTVPEPSTILLLLGGLFGMGWLRSRARH